VGGGGEGGKGTGHRTVVKLDEGIEEDRRVVGGG